MSLNGSHLLHVLVFRKASTEALYKCYYYSTASSPRRLHADSLLSFLYPAILFSYVLFNCRSASLTFPSIRYHSALFSLILIFCLIYCPSLPLFFFLAPSSSPSLFSIPLSSAHLLLPFLSQPFYFPSTARLMLMRPQTEQPRLPKRHRYYWST